ncbi:MAG: PKD domain-containing protein [Bacteroidales bacterium]
MKKILLIATVSLFAINLAAQVSEGGLPASYKPAGIKSSVAVPSYNLSELDKDALEKNETMNSLPLRYALLEDVQVDIRKNGKRTDMEDGSSYWQYRINSPAGKSVQVIFRKFLVPEGARLFLYNEGYSEIRGAFTDYNITENLMFVTGDFPGNHVIIEYYEPSDAPFEGEVIIGSVGQAYIDILTPESGNTDRDGYIGINCDEGIPLQNEKHSVCRYTFNDGTYSYLCSGALINNAGQSVRPYFLTAAHCISSAETAATIVAYFNYEGAACTSIVLTPSQTISGSSLLTTGSHSDFTLLKFDRLVPLSYSPYYAGWDAGDAAPESSSSIHHPGGSTKKLALDYDPAGINEIDLTWDGGGMSPSGTHWAVVFDEGITSSGSSGAPLFDQNKRITGQLHGGSEVDYYGKLSYSWNHANSGYPSLQSFLDPDGTGVKQIDGYYPASNLPDPQFATQLYAVCTNAPVQLTGFSAFDPTDYQWTFAPANVLYSDGTNSSSPSPKVSFLTEGNYAVTLKVINQAGENELSISNFIVAGSSLILRAFPQGLADSCVWSFSGLTLQAYGADAYLWTLSDKSDDLFYIVNNTVNPVEIKAIDGVSITSSTDIEVTLTGIHGLCQKLLNINIPLEAQSNDNVRNARAITAGASGPYSNSCATIEEGEPIPPYTDCTGQLSWCNEYGTGLDIVERSVWFSYTPEVNQTISISSSGFDNQIAVYSASSASALLGGNYMLLAANDDFTETNFNPVISSIDVKANQKYWIQVDGSAGGETGTFYLNLSVLSSIDDALTDEETRVYPIPADDYVFIESASFDRCSSVRVELADASGRIVLHDTLMPYAGRVQLLLGNLAPGIYMARIFCDGKMTVTKIVI